MRLRLGVVPEDPERADQIAAELSIEVGVLGPRFPPEPAERGAHQLADRVAESFPRLALQEAVAPGQPHHDRLPHRRRGLVGEAEHQIEERPDLGLPGDHRRPRVVDETLTFGGREFVRRARVSRARSSSS